MNALLSRLASSVFVVLAGAAMAQSPPAVRVASKIDTEGSLLGNMIVLVLEAKGIKTENRVQLGTTKIVRGAITAGEIDIYPEYTGNGAFFFADEKNPAWKKKPSWYVRGTGDKIIDPAAQEMMAKRARAKLTSVDSGHVPMLSKPDEVAKMVLYLASDEAARVTGGTFMIDGGMTINKGG